ncbi:MAG: 50S ribosomal protein L6 [Candidatus Parcubacteria bacterium]|nr:MAG: 50S ribosomal protein L6 [Candidatus Parcubacteria bacterium]
MSRIGKKPIILSDKVSVKKIDDSLLEINGPKGVVSFRLPLDFRLEINENVLTILPTGNLTKRNKAIYGTLRALLNNKIIGVEHGFEKILILEGLGYSAEVKEGKIFLKVGFSRPVELDIPKDINVEVKQEKGRSLIYVRGIDKEKVGNFAAKIKKVKKADRYHAKGFRYIDEIIKLKPVKKSVK